VKGTHLGIMWTDERGQILTAFGDTFGAGWTGFGSGSPVDPVKVDWRSNTLARSSDHDPAKGMSFDFVPAQPLPPTLRTSQSPACQHRPYQPHSKIS
jgi:hypothetical protein